jgi:hypothetical protein
MSDELSPVCITCGARAQIGLYCIACYPADCDPWENEPNPLIDVGDEPAAADGPGADVGDTDERPGMNHHVGNPGLEMT